MIYLVGEFDVTDSQGGINFKSSVEIDKNYPKAIFNISFSKFHSSEFLTFKFSNVKARSLLGMIKSILRNNSLEFKIFSGGTKKSKNILVSFSRDSIVLSAFEGTKNVRISIPKYEALALCDEVEYLIEMGADSTYKTQRVAARKREATSGGKGLAHKQPSHHSPVRHL